MKGTALVLGLVVGVVYAQGDAEKIPVENADKLTDPFEKGGKSKLLYPFQQPHLDTSPFPTVGRNLMLALFGYRTIEEAHLLREDKIKFNISAGFSTGKEKIVTTDYFFNYNATLLLVTGQLLIPVEDVLTINVDQTVGDLLEKSNEKIVLARKGKEIIGPRIRNFGLESLDLGLKLKLMALFGTGTLSLKFDLRIPESRKDTLLSSGGVDTHVRLLASQTVGAFSVHINLGLMSPGTPDVFEQAVTTKEALTYAGALVFKASENVAVGVQADLYESVFENNNDSIAIFSKSSGIVGAGVRIRVGSYLFRIFVGRGLGKISADFSLTLGLDLEL